MSTEPTPSAIDQTMSEAASLKYVLIEKGVKTGARVIDNLARIIQQLQAQQQLLASFHPRTFPERASDEFDAGYAAAVKDLHTLLANG